ncbi:hypothetical protein O6H91_12G103600 [Diphasiastrum complanatum]|uniref:Uncharacterized protein n=1 Tax=Diphasiastrum complanatum TaxID=34168 RepID=A0ACC2C5A4_DIPCM|nr:hypothetical protein O6H91_Y133000 [Diphasiastrum complanatum]KAJ7537221.1 hypothetical protein O6H91_12G103600 [Diphasiastrum complanatum]
MGLSRALLLLILLQVVVLGLGLIMGMPNDLVKEFRAAGFDLVADLLGSTDVGDASAFTLFTPGDASLALLSRSEPAIDLLRYHISPQWLSYNDLKSLPLGAQISTLLPNYTILVTSTAEGDELSNGLTLDNVEILLPDLYFDEMIVIHGISDIMNPFIYGAEQNITIQSQLTCPKEEHVPGNFCLGSNVSRPATV